MPRRRPGRKRSSIVLQRSCRSTTACGHGELLDPGALNLMRVIVFVPVKIECSCKCERDDERELLLGY